MGRKIKICHITTRLMKGGGTKDTIYLVNGLDKDKYEVDLIVGRDKYLPRIEKLNNVRLIQIDSMVRNINPLLDLKTLLVLYRIIKSNKYTLIHTYLAKAGILGRIAGKLAGVPIIVHTLLGCTFPETLNPLVRMFYMFVEKIVSKFTHCFICVGQDLKNQYIRQKIGDASKYVVIHSAIDLDSFFDAGRFSEYQIQNKKKELGLERDDIVIGKVARLVHGKGHIYAIEAAKLIVQRYPNVKFLFVGDSDNKEKLTALVDKYNLREHVIFTGHREDIASVVATFDIAVLTSLYEGLPRVLVEAAATGKPIVTFRVAGVSEIVKNNETGFIIPLRDVNQFVEKLNYLLANLSRAKKMGFKGKELIDNSWGIETMVQQTLKLYEVLISRCLMKSSSGNKMALGNTSSCKRRESCHRFFETQSRRNNIY